ncbi:MAG: hypothetical protein WCF36_18705 [Candidatus Nanopelagicales bacterium]
MMRVCWSGVCHWMRESGLADLLASLSETVPVGLSGMVMTRRIHCPDEAARLGTGQFVDP